MSDARIVAETILAGRYRLVRLIDRGGMAEVWEGRDEVLDRPVAIKVLHPRLAGDDAFQERFRREAVAAARLAHPNVVATFDTGMDGSVAYIVMELVTGRTLREVLKADGPLPVAKAVAIAAAVADALHYAHEAGIVHRDVKPANILMGRDGRVKVADFGIAKAASGRDLTNTGALLGTAKYLSPE
ncbi:MAG: serine/threonine protein kinase, partial [Acidimicrobiia bacterium]|nr:serine/threonine protein kinase [Acidimicrobiia bacterium]